MFELSIRNYVKCATANHHVNFAILNMMAFLAYQLCLVAIYAMIILEPLNVTKVNVMMLLATVQNLP